jgi:hypothetical protein
MYNFYIIEQGDKWAKTGTRFKPRGKEGHPEPESVNDSSDEAVDVKARASKNSPVLGPQGRAIDKRGRPVARATEAPQPGQAPRSGKVTPHGVRPVAGARNTNILGNRATPPPPTTREKGKQDGTPEESMAVSRVHEQQRRAKRHREDEETNMDLEFLGAGSFGWSVDESSARRYGMPGRHSKYMHGAPFPRGPFHHRRAWLPREEEQDFLYRSRPDVHGEVAGAVAHAVEMVYSHFQPRYGGYPHSWAGPRHGMDPMDPMAPLHPYSLDVMDPMQHPEARLLAYHSLTYSHLHYAEYYDYEEYERDVFWSAPAAACRPRDVVSPMKSSRVAHDWRKGKGEKCDTDDEGCEGMSHDDLLSCHPTPEGAQSIHEEFVGSPLELTEHHELEWLACSPTKGNASALPSPLAHVTGQDPPNVPELVEDALESD